MNKPKNRTEELWLEIDENIKKLTEVLGDIDPEIRYDRTLNALYISERALVKGRTEPIYMSIVDPDMANCFLVGQCRNPKLIRTRFELIKILTGLGYDTHISNINGPNIINAQDIKYITHKLFYFSQHSYAVLTNISNKTVDLEIHIVNELSGISDFKEKCELDGTSFDITTRVLTPSEDETINLDESHKCTLTNIPISNLRNEIVKARETVEKHSKLIAIDKLLRNVQ